MSQPSSTIRVWRAFTLIELLVTVGIIAILAAIVLPNLQASRVRALVARTKNDLRVVAHGLEAYHIDRGQYPYGRETPGIDPFGIFAIYSLSALTTPVGYIADSALADPFGPILPSRASAGSGAGRAGAQTDPGRPFPAFPDEPSVLFFNYMQFAEMRRNTRLAVRGYAILSVGPDRRDSFSVYLPFPDQLPAQAARFGIHHVADSIYDPTNGAISGGDIGRWGGEVAVPPPPAL